MIHYDPQHSEGECSHELSPNPESLSASSSQGSQGDVFSSQETSGHEYRSTQESSGTQSLQDMASQNLQQMKSQAVQKSNEITENVKSRASSYLDQQKGMAAEILQDVTEVTRHCGDELRQKNHPRLGDTIDYMAERMSDWGQSLRRQDVNYFVNRTQDFARQRPMLFLGGALALGFLAVRFLKSSGQPEPRSENTSGQSQQPYIQGIHNEVPASSGTQFTI